jgi:Flp pilus assembly protein TadG
VRSRSTDPARSALTARPGSERGSVTAETALALPAVVLVLAALLGCGQALVAQVNCVDAARAGARAAARSETDERVRARAGALARRSTVEVSRGPGLVKVVVTASVPLAPSLPPASVRCEAVAPLEQPDLAPEAP